MLAKNVWFGRLSESEMLQRRRRHHCAGRKRTSGRGRLHVSLKGWIRSGKFTYARQARLPTVLRPRSQRE